MASAFIGVVRSAGGDILAVINPDKDWELDDPAWTFNRGDTEMIRVPRGERFSDALTLEQVAALVEEHRR